MKTVFNKVIRLEDSDYSPSTTMWFEDMTRLHGSEIAKATRITSTTEWQLENFGAGSAWIFESPFVIRLTFTVAGTILEIIEEDYPGEFGHY